MFTYRNLLSNQAETYDRRSMENPHALYVGQSGDAMKNEIIETLSAYPEDAAIIMRYDDQYDDVLAQFPGRVFLYDLEGDLSAETDEINEMIRKRFRQRKHTWFCIDGLEAFCGQSCFRNLYDIIRQLHSRMGVFGGTLVGYEGVVNERMMVQLINICGVMYLFRSEDSPALTSMLYDLPIIITRKVKTLAKGRAVMVHDAIYDFIETEIGGMGNDENMG